MMLPVLGACRSFDHGAVLGPGQHLRRWNKLTIALLWLHFFRLGSAAQSAAPSLGRIPDSLLAVLRKVSTCVCSAELPWPQQGAQLRFPLRQVTAHEVLALTPLDGEATLP